MYVPWVFDERSRDQLAEMAKLITEYGPRKAVVIVRILPTNLTEGVLYHLRAMKIFHNHYHKFRMKKTLCYIHISNKIIPLQRAVKDWYYSPRSKYAITTIDKCDKLSCIH